MVQVSCQVTYPILTIVALVFLMALPVWIASHVYVVIRARTLVGYFELRERGRAGETVARVSFFAWNVAIACITVFLFASFGDLVLAYCTK